MDKQLIKTLGFLSDSVEIPELEKMISEINMPQAARRKRFWSRFILYSLLTYLGGWILIVFIAPLVGYDSFGEESWTTLPPVYLTLLLGSFAVLVWYGQLKEEYLVPKRVLLKKLNESCKDILRDLVLIKNGEWGSDSLEEWTRSSTENETFIYKIAKINRLLNERLPGFRAKTLAERNMITVYFTLSLYIQSMSSFIWKMKTPLEFS